MRMRTPANGSQVISEENIPPGLDWQPKDPDSGYRTQLAYGECMGVYYRRLTFPSGEHMYSIIEYDLVS